jgi:hypothetical protein
MLGTSRGPQNVDEMVDGLEQLEQLPKSGHSPPISGNLTSTAACRVNEINLTSITGETLARYSVNFRPPSDVTRTTRFSRRFHSIP